MMALLAAGCFVWFFTASLWTVNSLRRPVPPGQGFPPLWLPGMVVSELAPLFFLVRIIVVVLFVAAGAHENPVGQAGIGLFAVSQLGLVVIMLRSLRAARDTTRSPRGLTLLKLFERRPRTVRLIEEVPYSHGLTLDAYRQTDVENAPTLIYVHPGSWMRGRPGRQARTLFHRLAKRGWVVLDIRYPLSPAATFPEHLIGVKQAIAWAKGAGHEFGVDPLRVSISGGSSGAHLAALAALSSGNTDLQPGFEDVDTSVLSCVPFYGIYDLLVRNPTRYDWPFIARYVMKTSPADAPDLYELGSPIDQVHPQAPPFLVVHGEFDSVVLAAESQNFVDALRNAGVDADYYEVGAAQHGFDAIASIRSRAVAAMVADWLVKRAG